MNRSPKPNIAVKANIWCDPQQRDPEAVPYFLQEKLPGDLLIEFLGTREVRITRAVLTHEQHREYEQSRFFQGHGQDGLAFEPWTQRFQFDCETEQNSGHFYEQRGTT